jgi:hypothetical protein
MAAKLNWLAMRATTRGFVRSVLVLMQSGVLSYPADGAAVLKGRSFGRYHSSRFAA